jgi:hypothetical protein
MAGQARDLRVITGCQSPLIITARACPALPRLLAQALSQADLQAILAHLNNGRDELLSGTSAGFPVVAVRVRASVGRPGGSARAQWRRMRAAEWTAWTRTRTLPWRIAVIVGVGAVGGLLGGLLTPDPAGGVVRGRPGRPGPCPTRAWPWYRLWRPRRPGPLGQGGHAGRAGGVGPALAKHASPAPAVLGPKRVAWLADQARVRFHAAA